jgi:flagellar M-ring protein FliF
MLRQVGLLVGLAASVAIGVAIVLWAQEPSYGVLFSSLPDTEVARVADALDQTGIRYRVDGATGTVMVPQSKVHDARIRLATQGIPNVSESGFELLDKDSGLGTSRLIETARYHRAIEGELTRSIMTLSSVESARVHLAIPKQSVFIRNRTKPTASVLLNLYSGRQLSEDQVAGIVHMVASSVPGLETDQVTVVDQRGRLLTAGQASTDTAMRDEQFKFARRIEETYVKRIHALLAPIVGEEGVRAEVTADVDFSVVETTSETFVPDQAKVRSEQIAEDESMDNALAGVPGALTNQPPAAGVVDPNASGEIVDTTPTNSSRRVVRNYELDRTVSHTRIAPGVIRRLSVAVVVDHREERNEQGRSERVPLSEEELGRMESLVREAVGFDATRGDSVNVMNVSFKEAGPVRAPPAPPIWKEAWVWDAVKQVAGGLAVLLLFFFVLRPALRSLAEKGKINVPAAQPALAGGEPMPPGLMADERLSLTNQAAMPGAQAGASYEQRLGSAKNLVHEDPKRVAQVVKTWVAADE